MMNRFLPILAVLTVSGMHTSAEAQFVARSATPKITGVTGARPGSGGFAQGADDCASPHTNAGTGDVSGVPFVHGTTGTTGQSESACYAFGLSGIENDVWFDLTFRTSRRDFRPLSDRQSSAHEAPPDLAASGRASARRTCPYRP
jgi:hypothetical protein